MLRNLLSLRFLVALLAVGVAAIASPPAEAKFAFDYNHPDLNWYTIETEHFFVHYPVSKKTREEGNEHYLTGEFAARKSAEVAEEMWAPICELFDYYLKEKVHIVILNQSDGLEGFTIPSWDWVEISANVGGYFWRVRGRMEWFSDVIVHEFAHVVSLKANTPMSEGAFGIELGGLYSNGKINADVGGSVMLSDGAPFWWTEGGAEYWSDEADYNWWSSSRDHNIRTTVLEDRLLTYDEWGTRVEKRDFGDGERGYQQGYSIALYLRERFGPDIYAEFALASGERWRLEWEDVIKEVTGVEAETLYDDWVAFLQEGYGAVKAGVEADGEVVGGELLHNRQEWEYRDPDARDAWLEKKPRDREDAKEGTGTWITEPRYSEEGELYGVNSRGQLKISWAPEGTFLPFSGRELSDPEISQKMADYKTSVGMAFGHGFDFVPGQRAVVFTGYEDYTYADKGRHLKSLLNINPEFDGYNWKQIWYWDLKEYERSGWLKANGREYVSLDPERGFGGVRKFPDGTIRPVPNTLRGVDPAVSPDGSKIAYFEYTDGTLNLVTINLDGTEKKHLTNYADGTWMQRVDWSPDGSQLVFQMFHNYRYDLWTINADGTNLSPLTWDEVEELDAHWAKDGLIYFSADPTGIFNIFSMDPETKKVMQLTNVVSSAQLPFLTPTGNLLYVQWTAHGNKQMGLAKEEFLNRDVTEMFGKPVEKEEYEAFAAFQEDLSHWAEHTRKYKARKSLMTPYFVPMVRFGNDSLTNFGLQGGGQVYIQDFVEDHVLSSDILLG
ncbi:MAG: hypothetical protein VX519_03935 [Myxococcota bacterium]|nr:hypothetical protein [Myxococcota bacterium]